MKRDNLVKQFINEGYSDDKLVRLMRQIAPAFRYEEDTLDFALQDGYPFENVTQLGIIELDNITSVIVASAKARGELTERSSKRKQYELAKRILKATNHNAGIFAFYDDKGRFRLSLVTVTYHGTRRQFSTYRRYTFFVDPELPNKTFFQQFRKANFSSLDGILETFSLEAVSDEFYREFKPHFDRLAKEVRGTDDPALKQDFALLFVIRTIFLGFVQKKGWLGKNPKFLQSFWQEYLRWKARTKTTEDLFYKRWLEVLFFEALSSPPGRKVAYGNAPFSEETQRVLQMAPYLNGELFKRKRGVDDRGLWIPDELIGDFFEFIFQYNFTVEENELYDEELELNPEFLGIIFERLTNMEQGAVYTPRVEVDMMSRLALIKWLERTTDIPRDTLYRYFFPAESPREVPLTPEQIRTLINRLESVTACDPAAGSGAFEVGMLQVLDRALEDLYSRKETPAELKDRAPTPFERKKAIIARSLYGVDVKRWAVWINHLRLWLTLFVDMPDDFQQSYEPLLPNLTFKVRVGDSLVQRIGDKTFPVHGHANLPANIKRRITRLKQKKRDFFYNRLRDYALIEKEELDLFRDILDAQIASKMKEIQENKQKIQHLQQLAESKLFDRGLTAKEKKQINQLSERIKELQAEIDDLKAQKQSLRDERPFIWSLEFAEIFFDKGGFDVIIGNPPYLGAHSKDETKKLTDPLGHLSPQEYKNALLEMVRLDFPEYFAKSSRELHRFKKDRKPSGRSDLYTYFYIRSLRLLNDKGVHVFICSNAWLDVSYGAWLQEFFLRKAPLYMVIDNHARRSFARADINTVITVAAAPLPGHREVPRDHIVRFVAFKKPFEEVVNADNFISIENAQKVLKTPHFRVFPITVEELLKESSEPSPMGPGKYVGNKWGGKYLRAPDIFFKIIQKSGDNLKRLRDFAEILGYIHDNSTGEKYPKVPFIKSVQDTRRVRLTEETAILYGVKPYGRQKTHPLRKADLLFPRTLDDVHLILWNEKRKVVGKEFYRIIFEQENPFLMALLMNSTFSILQREIWGLHNLGGGALKFSTYCVGFFLVPTHVSIPSSLKEIMHTFVNRKMNSIFTEIGIDPKSDIPISEQEPNPLPDRKALDNIVFDALDLTEEERKEVYRAVAQLVWERTCKAKSVKKRGRKS